MYRHIMPQSYQNQRDHYSPNYYPRPEAFMYMNPPPLNNNQYWPWGTGYPYPPATCHGCCTHTQMPSHNAWSPPYSHIPPPYYPPFPTQYAYPKDQHCSGCLCNQKEHTSVRIQEEPERQEIHNKIAPDNPVHPVIWFPSDTKEHQRDSKHVSADAKHNSEWNSDEKQPLGRFGWYPSHGSPKYKGERLGGQESIDGKGSFPFPAYWMPYTPEEKDEPTKKHVVDPKPSLEPVRDGGQPRSVVKYIPVKELKPHEETPTTPTIKDRSDSSIKDVTGTKEKLNKNDPKAKSSKLPPVCLRVDPLPRRKDRTGSSRSSIPAEDRKKPDKVSSTTAPKEKPDHTTDKESKECKGAAKVIKVVDGSDERSRIQMQTEEKHENGRIPAECTKSNNAEVQSEDSGSARAGNRDVSIAKKEAIRPNKPKLSEEDAAVTIQSAYRGFDIRRWEPVKKLKEIAAVREQIAEVRELIQAMESSSDIQEGSKQRNIIAETIMSLLLKLDTVQVLDPSVREVRKSVVRELVCLQEELDALIDKKMKSLQKNEPVAPRRDENVLKESADVTPSHDSNKTESDLVEACQNQFDGVLNKDSEMEDILVASNLENEASEVSESCMPENSRPAVEPTKLKEGEPSSQIGGSSPTKEDGTDSELRCGIECSVDEVVDSLSDKEKIKSEQSLEEEGGNLPMLSDAERGELDQAKQPYEGMEEAHISETNHDTSKGERECTDSIDELDVPLGENNNTKSDATEIANSVDCLSETGCTSFEGLGTTKQVDSGCDPDECSVQSPENVFSDIFKPADEKDNPISEEAPNVEDTNINAPEEDSSVVEKAPDMLPNMEQEAEQEPIADIDEKVAEGITSDMKGSDQCSVEQSQEAEYELQVFNEEKQTAQNQEHFLQQINEDECLEGEGAYEEDHTPEIKSVAAAEVNEGKPISRDDEKPIEENEKLRDMVEKLVKSGEEQLRVISSLSCRIKHLERNLSKKRKLKVKPHNGKKTNFSERVD